LIGFSRQLVTPVDDGCRQPKEPRFMFQFSVCDSGAGFNSGFRVPYFRLRFSVLAKVSPNQNQLKTYQNRPKPANTGQSLSKPTKRGQNRSKPAKTAQNHSKPNKTWQRLICPWVRNHAPRHLGCNGPHFPKA